MDQDTHAELERLLKELEDEERALSASRRRMHDRIDLFGGTDGPEGAAADEMVRQERELSERRRELQRRIDTLRARRDGAAF
jgi:hypothetical protein